MCTVKTKLAHCKDYSFCTIKGISVNYGAARWDFPAPEAIVDGWLLLAWWGSREKEVQNRGNPLGYKALHLFWTLLESSGIWLIVHGVVLLGLSRTKNSHQYSKVRLTWWGKRGWEVIATYWIFHWMDLHCSSPLLHLTLWKLDLRPLTICMVHQDITLKTWELLPCDGSSHEALCNGHGHYYGWNSGFRPISSQGFALLQASVAVAWLVASWLWLLPAMVWHWLGSPTANC